MPPNSTSPSSSSSHRHTRSRSLSLSQPQSQPPPPPPPPKLHSIDPKIWRACAGNSVAIPTLYSRVYYFPQGHLEHSTASAAAVGSVQLSRLLLSRPSILCRVAGVQFLADPTTDEVFAKVLLHPIYPGYDLTSTAAVAAADEGGGEDGDGGYRVVAFAKILTPSDANNGGGFSVPRFCADSIFPPLNYQAEPPVQNLTVTDLHGVAWDFRHIYRGTPRRHLLTTGWSKFVNHKMLVAGDSVVFMRNSGGEMYIGVRRTVRASHGGDYGRWSAHIGGLKSPSSHEEGNAGRGGDGFKVRLSLEAVAEAAEMAAQNMPFEVVYYPKAQLSEFVVKAEVVERAMSGFWTRGMRVKMAMETDDSSRMTWFQGTLSSVTYSDNMPWPRSPWRMLQVTWDEPEVLQNDKWVSPWQVDFVASTPSLHSPPSLHSAPPLHTLPSFHSAPSLLTPPSLHTRSSLHTPSSPHTAPSLHTAPFLHTVPPTKRFRAPLNHGLLRNGEEDFMIPMTGGANSTMGHFDASMLNYTNFPAGMQGARQDLFCVSNVAHLLHENTPQMGTNSSFGNNMEPRLKRVSTELNIGSPPSDHLSPESHSSPHSFGLELDGNRYCNSTKSGKSSFQLFGKIIHMEEPSESNDAVGIGNNETELLNNQLDLSYTKLLQRIDVRVSAVEACTL